MKENVEGINDDIFKLVFFMRIGWIKLTNQSAIKVVCRPQILSVFWCILFFISTIFARVKIHTQTTKVENCAKTCIAIRDTFFTFKFDLSVPLKLSFKICHTLSSRVKICSMLYFGCNFGFGWYSSVILLSSVLTKRFRVWTPLQ